MKWILDRLDEMGVCKVVSVPLTHQRVSKVEACHRVANVGWTHRAKSGCSKGKEPRKAKEE